MNERKRNQKKKRKKEKKIREKKREKSRAGGCDTYKSAPVARRRRRLWRTVNAFISSSSSIFASFESLCLSLLILGRRRKRRIPRLDAFLKKKEEEEELHDDDDDDDEDATKKTPASSGRRRRKTGKELYDAMPKYIRDKIINPEVLIRWKPEDGEMPAPEYEPVPAHPPRQRCPEGTELPYPWESEVGKPLPNERLIRKMLAVPKMYRQPDGSLGPKPRPKNPWTVANRKEFSDLVHYCRTNGGLTEADGYKDGVSYRYNIGCTWTQHRLYMEQIHQYPEINERGEWFGFDPKKIHPIDDDPTHFITKAKAESYRELEKRGINGTTLDNMFKEETLNKSGGWHWDDGTKPSHSDGGPNEDKTKEDIDSEPEDPETATCPESLKWIEDQIAAEKKERERQGKEKDPSDDSR